MKFLLTLAFLFPAFAVGQTDYDIRKARWGMAEEEVRKTEEVKPILDKVLDNGARFVVYETKQGSDSCFLGYYFTDSNQLYMVFIQFTDRHKGRDDKFIDDYNRVKSLLEKKYGDPSSEDEEWSSSTSKQVWGDQPEVAVKMGHLTYESNWIVESDGDVRTYIEHTLEGEDYEIKHNLTYQSADYWQEVSTDDY